LTAQCCYFLSGHAAYFCKTQHVAVPAAVAGI